MQRPSHNRPTSRLGGIVLALMALFVNLATPFSHLAAQTLVARAPAGHDDRTEQIQICTPTGLKTIALHDLANRAPPAHQTPCPACPTCPLCQIVAGGPAIPPTAADIWRPRPALLDMAIPGDQDIAAVCMVRDIGARAPPQTI